MISSHTKHHLHGRDAGYPMIRCRLFAVHSHTRRFNNTSSIKSVFSNRYFNRLLQRASASAPSDFDLGEPQQARDTSLGPRDDDVLPESLADALKQAAEATAAAIQRSNARCQVEILLTEFWDPISGPIFPNRGDQERFWKMTRRFLEEFSRAMQYPDGGINAVYPDSGVAAMLSHQWKGTGTEASGGALPFRITSLNDRTPVSPDDMAVVVACPDPQGAEECMRLVRIAGEQDEAAGREMRPIVLFNPRMSSGDVGLGLNARRLRENFTKNFTVTYSLRPINDVGSVYRRYPEMWKVFLEEEGMSGRYKLIAEKPSRPAGEALDFILMEATNPGQIGADGQKQPGPGGFLGQLQSTVNSMQRFMKALGN